MTTTTIAEKNVTSNREIIYVSRVGSRSVCVCVHFKFSLIVFFIILVRIYPMSKYHIAKISNIVMPNWRETERDRLRTDHNLIMLCQIVGVRVGRPTGWKYEMNELKKKIV